MKRDRLSLDNVEWKVFKIKDFFKIQSVNGKPISNYKEGKIPYITTSSQNNGVNSFVESSKELSPKKAISVDPIAGKAFFHEYDFIGRGGAGSAINLLYNDKLDKFSAQFICTALEKVSKEKASYGWALNGERLKNTKITMPVDKSGNPNWQFMEDYIKQEQKDIAQKVIDYYEQKMLEVAFDLVGLENLEWKVFSFDEIFRKIQRGKRLKKNDHIKGNTPYVSSTSLNNGVDGFIGNKEDIRKFTGNLSLANSGSVGACFYHQYEYIASDHVTALTLKDADKHLYLFMATIVKRLEEKYSFNREINDKRIRSEKLLLPVDENGNPHWEYMSQFMQKIEAEKLHEVLAYMYTERERERERERNSGFANFYQLLDAFISRLQNTDTISRKQQCKNSRLKEEPSFSKHSDILSLREKIWKEFFLEDIVNIESGIDIYASERIDGQKPYITATSQNNGIGYFVKNSNRTLERQCISVNRNGSVGYSFYHDYPALYGNDTRKLIPKFKDKYISLFLTCVITLQKEKYGYGYKMGTARLKRQKIMLPCDTNGNPDFAYMRKYMQIEEIKNQYQIIAYYRNLINPRIK